MQAICTNFDSKCSGGLILQAATFCVAVGQLSEKLLHAVSNQRFTVIFMNYH